MPYIIKLALSHFRSHKFSNLDLDCRPVAIYGPNGSGKTNILEAISLFSPGKGLRRANAQNIMRRPENLGWKVSGSIEHLNKVTEIEFYSNNGSTRKIKIEGKSSSQIKLSDLVQIIWLIPSMDRLWMDGAESRRKFLDRITLSIFSKHAQIYLEYEKALRERNRLLKEQVNDWHWYNALEQQMASSAISICRNRKKAIELVTESMKDTTTQFPVAKLELSQIEGELPTTEEGFSRAFHESRSFDLKRGRTSVGPHRTDLIGTYEEKGIVARDCSTGEQKALLISVILANARAVTKIMETPPMVLLDEITAHLDLAARSCLYQELFSLGSQAWMTGTEKQLFQDLGDKVQLIKVSEEGGLSNVTRG